MGKLLAKKALVHNALMSFSHKVGSIRKANRERMRDLGDRIRELRGGRPVADVVVVAAEVSGENLSDDWWKRIESGSRVSFSPWEIGTLAAALASNNEEALLLTQELEEVIGWSNPCDCLPPAWPEAMLTPPSCPPA